MYFYAQDREGEEIKTKKTKTNPKNQLTKQKNPYKSQRGILEMPKKFNLKTFSMNHFTSQFELGFVV